MTDSPFIVFVLILAVVSLFGSAVAGAEELCFFEHNGNQVLYRPIDDMEILEVRLADRPDQVIVVRDSDGDALLRSRDDLIFRRYLETEEGVRPSSPFSDQSCGAAPPRLRRPGPDGDRRNLPRRGR